ncbi:cytochrome c oxidase assembly protein [Streptomyces sp. Tu 2975]|uniref:cytochrome c oxidase assembly protein n=1 Tax=Streptomyces sp. Tu 2975 TaxID=2676871 RepID=UPI001FC9C208|nr:cytochrome c oxidase assembly protein [Streptomyces sp. Tu 2975]
MTAAVSLLAVAGYLAAAVRLRRRGDAWPWVRDASFTTGGAGIAYVLLVALPGGPFTAHVIHHLIVVMAAPLLLVLARPLTLALRVLPPRGTRRALLAVAHSRPVAWLVFPPTAAVLDVGGLWVIHRTDLLAQGHQHMLMYAAVHTHVVAAGLLFTFAVCRLDPVRRSWGLAWRGSTLLLAGAAHAVLAKSLYATPPPGTHFAPSDLRSGAVLMYYGGDLVEIGLATVLAVQWYAGTGRACARLRRRAAAAAAAVQQRGSEVCLSGLSAGHKRSGAESCETASRNDDVTHATSSRAGDTVPSRSRSSARDTSTAAP